MTDRTDDEITALPPLNLEVRYRAEFEGRLAALVAERDALLAAQKAAEAERDAAVRTSLVYAEKVMAARLERDALAARLQAVRELCDRWEAFRQLPTRELRDALLVPLGTPEGETATKPAAELLREIAERDPEGHAARLGRAYLGADANPEFYPAVGSPEGETAR